MNISKAIEDLTAIREAHGDLEFRMNDPEGYDIIADYFRLLYPRDIHKGWLEDKTKPPYGVMAEY